MAEKIGIPRALLYYEYYPLFKTFFEELGISVILSDKSNKQIVNEGSSYCVDEACLPIKLFHGHVANLIGKVDYIFVPRFKSIAKGEYICPKFCGLPEMVKNSVPGIPKIIDTEINMRKRVNQIYEAFIEIAAVFKKNKLDALEAFKEATKEQQKFRDLIKKGMYPNEILHGKKLIKANKSKLKIALVGHVYNIYDQYVCMELLDKLVSYGAEVITPEFIEEDILENKADSLNKRMFWSYGKRHMCSTLHFIDRKDIDGIIYLMSFGCGVDALVSDLCERRVRRESCIPFLLLTLDEHSGEAGFNTRLEAFIDMVVWRMRNEGNVSAYG